MAELPHPSTQIDFRPYAGQHVIVAHSANETPKQTWYVLGTIVDDLPAHVKALIQDDAYECSELLYVVSVEPDGERCGWAPLVVFDDREKLRYGLEFLAAVQRTGKPGPCFRVDGVHFEEGA